MDVKKIEGKQIQLFWKLLKGQIKSDSRKIVDKFDFYESSFSGSKTQTEVGWGVNWVPLWAKLQVRYPYETPNLKHLQIE